MITDEQAIDQLADALARMYAMWEKMMTKVNHGASWYDADTLREMNEAPIQAYKALALVGKQPEKKP